MGKNGMMTSMVESLAKVTIIGVFIAFSGCSGKPAQASSPAANKQSAGQELKVDQLEGEWVSQKFIEKVRTEKSYVYDGDLPGLVTFKIEKSGNMYSFSSVYNFHEGADPYYITGLKSHGNKDYQFVLASEPGNGETSDQFGFTLTDNPDVIYLRFWNNSNVFVRLHEDVEVHCNKLLLAGKYIDENNREYVFGTESIVLPNGKAFTAAWPDKTFRYELNLDSVGCSVNYFSDIDNLQADGYLTSYVYEWRDGKLHIYSEGDSEMIEKGTLLHVLTPIKDNAPSGGEG